MPIAQSLEPDTTPGLTPQRNKAYDQLRRLLLLQQVPAGRLREAHWALKLGVNRAALREALARLQGEGFIAKEDKKGYYLPVLTDEQIHEIIEVRTVLEGGAIERICRTGMNNPSHLKKMRDACDHLDRVIREEDPGGVPEWDRRFHEALVEAADNRRLALLYLLAPLPIVQPEVLEDRNWKESCRHTLQEHRAILECTLEGKPDQAIRQLRSHLNKRFRQTDEASYPHAKRDEHAAQSRATQT